MINVRLVLFFLIQVFFLIHLFNVPATGSNKELPNEIFKHWVHSFEDDTKDVAVFRPSNYNFPPARGRGGFEIKENGNFIQYGIAPADGTEKVYGHWKARGRDKILVYLRSKETLSYTINIISCTNDVLKVKK